MNSLQLDWSIWTVSRLYTQVSLYHFFNLLIVFLSFCSHSDAPFSLSATIIFVIFGIVIVLISAFLRNPPFLFFLLPTFLLETETKGRKVERRTKEHSSFDIERKLPAPVNGDRGKLDRENKWLGIGEFYD